MDLDKINLYLENAASTIIRPKKVNGNSLRIGVDLGTAYSVLAVADSEGYPLACALTRSSVVREGLIYDFPGAVRVLKDLKMKVEGKIGTELEWGATSFPPGTEMASRRATGYVLEAAGMHLVEMIDEPSAANAILNIDQGAIVDVGGGTTGIAIIQEGKIIHSADEPTGGTHFSLVIAGNKKISLEVAEDYKLNPDNYKEVFSIVRPVIEKVGAIIDHHIKGFDIKELYLVGGTCTLKGMAEVIKDQLGIPCYTPVHPMLVTPFGIALHGSNKD